MSRVIACRRWIAGVVAMLFLGTVLPHVGLAQAPHVRMQNVVKDFVKQTGNQVMGLGSWIEGTNYKLGVSDQDLRLLVPPGTNNKDALKHWEHSRQVMRDLVQKEFGADAGKMLAKTNLYPPSQLMNAVEDSADAARRYQALNGVPTLSHTGPVNAGVATKYSEGLYGEGSKAWTQHYEQTKGKLFYPSVTSKGELTCYSGAADLTHMAEGQAKFSAKGMGNTALGWAEHAAEELKSGDPSRVAKYLERIDRDLNKARELAGAGGNDAIRRELKELTESLRRPGADVASKAGRIEQILKFSRLEANVLTRLEGAGSAQRGMLEAALKDLSAKGTLASQIMAAAEKVPVGAILDGLMLAVVANEAGKTAGERSIAEAIAKAVPQLASLPVGILTEITDKCLEGAKEGGATLVASTQEAMDLIGGIHSAKGREAGFEPTAKMEYTLDDLVRNIHEQSKLDGFVYNRAVAAADRGGGTALSKGDKGAAEAIFQKNFPIILKAWQRKREEHRREYIRLLNKLRATPILLTYEPNPATMPPDGKPMAIPVKASMPGVDFYGTKERLKELARILAGKNVYVKTSVQFKGKDEGDVFTETYQYKQPGSYEVSATISVKCNGNSMTGENAGLKTEFSRAASVTVEVGSPDGGAGIFAGTLTDGKFTAGLRFTIRGTTVEGQLVPSTGSATAFTGTFDPNTRSLRVHSTSVLTLPAGGYSLKFERTFTLTGTYDGKEFKGTWRTTTGDSASSGTWRAAGALAQESGPSSPAKPVPTGKP